MSDIEEVVIPKSSKPKKDTKPEIARLKMKEKRERLKKEKEDSMINEAKNRLAQELEKKKLEEEKKKLEEEEKKLIAQLAKYEDIDEAADFILKKIGILK
jgi:transcriptional regulator of heat shock response